MKKIKTYWKFINESSGQELAAIRDLIEMGLITDPSDQIAELLDEHETLGGFDPSTYPLDLNTGTMAIRFSFDPGYHFPELAEDLERDLGLELENELSPVIELLVDIDVVVGTISITVEVEDLAAEFSDELTTQLEQSDSFIVTSPSFGEEVLAAIEDFLLGGNDQYKGDSTQCYEMILTIYQRRRQEIEDRLA